VENTELPAIQILESRRKIPDNEHPNIIQTITNGASAYHQQSQYSKAEPLNRQDIASDSTILNSVDSGDDGMKESRYGQDTANTSTQLTSIDSRYDKMEQFMEENVSIYTSNDTEPLKYIEKIATSLFGNLEPPDSSCLKRVHSILPELLRGFALRIGREKNSSTHFEVMKFVHRKRE
jgi:hypothetical protein